MVKIATPISHLFNDRSTAEEIIAASDCLEVRENSLNSDWPREHLFHFDIDINHEWDEEKRKFLNVAFNHKPDLQLISFQATTCCSSPKLVDKMFEVGGKIWSRDEMMNSSIKNIDWLRKTVNSDIMIAIENNNYYPTKAYDVVTDGEFLSEIVYENNIYLLFDIAHALITAQNKSQDYSGYKETLPLDRIIQLHICKPDLSSQIAYDTHEKPNASIYEEVFSLIIEYPTIEYLTVEYYKEKESLIDSVKHLKHSLDFELA